MRKFEVKRTTPVAIFLFVFLVIANNFTFSSDLGKDYELLINTGNKYLLDGEYEKAVEVFQETITLIKAKNKLAHLFQLLSLVYFKMGDKERCEESLREMFEQNPGKRINAKEYENMYIVTFNKVKAEYWYGLKTISEEEEASEQKIIEKLAHKPKKKKNKLIRILVIAGVAILLGVVTVILLGTNDKNKNPEIATLGKLRIGNLSDTEVWFTLAHINGYLLPGQSSTHTIKEGVYVLTFFDDNHSLTQIVEIFPQLERRIYFSGWEDSVQVKTKR